MNAQDYCKHFGTFHFKIENEWLKMGIAYYLHYIINELSWAIKIGLMVSTVPINFINFSDSFPSSFLANKWYKLLKPKRKVFFLVKLMLYNPLWTLKFLGELSWIFGWIVQFVWVNWPKSWVSCPENWVNCPENWVSCPRKFWVSWFLGELSCTRHVIEEC